MLNSRLALGRIAEDGGNNSAKRGKWHQRDMDGYIFSSIRASLRALCVFAPLQEPPPERGSQFSQRRKGGG
jgi:hypothetical protein